MPKIYFRLPQEPAFERVQKAISEVCEKLGLEMEGIREADRLTWIENTSFMIADITMRSENPRTMLSVFYEIGYARRAQKSILLISQKEGHASPGFGETSVLLYDPEDLGAFAHSLTVALIALCNKKRIRYNRYPGIPEVPAEEIPPILAEKDMRMTNYTAIADACVEAENYEEAFQEYSRAIVHAGMVEQGKEHAFLYAKRAYVNQKLGKLEDSLADYSQAVAILPDYLDAYMARGSLYMRLKRYTESLADFYKACELRPNYTRAYVLAGAVHRLKGEYDEAIVQLEKAIALDSELSTAFYYRGLVHVDKGNLGDGISDFSRVIELDKRNAQAYLQRGLAYNSLQKYDQAIADFDFAVSLEPNSPVAYSYRGQAYFEKGYQEFHKLAIRDWEQAMELGATDKDNLEEKIRNTRKTL